MGGDSPTVRTGRWLVEQRKRSTNRGARAEGGGRETRTRDIKGVSRKLDRDKVEQREMPT